MSGVYVNCSAMWRNWAGDQQCVPARDRAPEHRRRAACRAARARRRQRVRGGVRPLVHRHRLHRRAHAADGGPEPGARRGPRERPGEGRGRDRAARPERAPGRHGLALENLGDIDGRRLGRDLDRDPRHGRASGTSPARSRRWSWCSPTAACSRLRESDPRRCGRRGSGWRPRGDRHRHAARSPPSRSTGSTRRAAGDRSWNGRRSRRRQRPLRVLRLPAHRDRAVRESEHVDETPKPRNPPRGRGGGRARELGVGAHGASRGAARPRIPRLNRFVSPSAGRARSTAATGSSPASGKVRFTEMEYGVRAAGRRGGAAGARRRRARRGSPSASRSRSASSPPTTPSSAPRTSATPATSPSTCTRGWPGSPTSARSRRSWTTTGAARTGESATSRPRRRWPSATRTGTLPGRARPARPRRALPQRVLPTGCWAGRPAAEAAGRG